MKYNTLGIPENLAVTEQVFAPYFDGLLQAERMQYIWAIRTAKSSFVGTISLSKGVARFRKAELAYSLVPAHWGKGYATEALKRVIAFGFDTLGLHRLDAGVAVENVASFRVMEKAGMVREGRHRKILPIPSGWSDNYSYAILESDPRT